MRRQNEYELISYPKLADCLIFFVDLIYRPMHLHKELELDYIVSGKCTVSNERESFEASAGDFLLFESDSAHEIYSDEGPVRLLSIQIARSFCRRYYPQIQNLRFSLCGISACFDSFQKQELMLSMVWACADYLSQKTERIFSCMSHINRIFSILTACVPYQLLDSSLAATQAKSTDRLHRILHYLEEHSREPIRLSDLAASEHLTETYLSQFFKKQMHISFQEYLSRLRLEDAMYLLKTTDMTLMDVAYTSGFSDPKYLNQSFRKHLNTTPQKWRQSGAAAAIVRKHSSDHTMQRILSEQACLELSSKMLDSN